MAVAWPGVRASLVTILRGLLEPDVPVYDGPVVTGEAPLKFLSIGHRPSSRDEPAGDFDQDIGPDGFTVAESGSIIGELAAVTGDTTMPTVFDTFDVIASAIQSDQSLAGALGAASTVTVAAAVAPSQTTAGAVQRLFITVSYTTRL